MDVTGGQHLGKPFGGLVADHHKVLEASCRGGQVLGPDATSVEHLHKGVTVPVPAGRLHD